jgi:hypothetical protein
VAVWNPGSSRVAVAKKRGILRRVLITAMTVALLIALMALPAVAKGPHAKATGTVEWTARGGTAPGFVTSFSVHDVDEGGMGDRGFWTLSRPGYVDGYYTVDVSCVNVEGDEAWFAGVVTEVSGDFDDGRFEKPVEFWVQDLATSGSGGDLIGGSGPNRYSTLAKACLDVEKGKAGAWTGTGEVTGGNLKTHAAS